MIFSLSAKYRGLNSIGATIPKTGAEGKRMGQGEMITDGPSPAYQFAIISMFFVANLVFALSVWGEHKVRPYI
jgi:hypothetical protein